MGETPWKFESSRPHQVRRPQAPGLLFAPPIGGPVWWEWWGAADARLWRFRWLAWDPLGRGRRATPMRARRGSRPHRGRRHRARNRARAATVSPVQTRRRCRLSLPTRSALPPRPGHPPAARPNRRTWTTISAARPSTTTASHGPGSSACSRPSAWRASATSASPIPPASQPPARRSPETPTRRGSTRHVGTWWRSSPMAPPCSVSAPSARLPASR